MQSTDLSDADKEWLRRGGPFPDLLQLTTPSGGRLIYEVEGRNAQGLVVGVAERAGRKGFVLFVRDPESYASFAAKLCLLRDYGDENGLRQELRYASRLTEAGDLFAVPILAGVVPRFYGQPNTAPHWACFIVPRIAGRTLSSWLSLEPDKITPDLSCEIARRLIAATHFLASRGLKHDDLHTGNLMLRPIDPALYRGSGDRVDYALTVIDTGSLKPADEATQKPHDDWSRVAKVLAELHNAIFRNRVLASRYRKFLDMLAVLCSDLIEPDKSRVFPHENSIGDRVEAIQRELRFPAPLSTPRFEPFDAISAEHLANDRLLLDLFVKALPWMEGVRTARPTVLTGPRGCGKSMLMRYLAARTHLATPDTKADFLDDIPFLGVYVSCSSDLQADVLWLGRDTSIALEKGAQVCTLFSLLLARETFRLLDQLLHAQTAADRLNLTTSQVSQLIEFCKEYLPSYQPLPRLRVSSVAGDFAEELDQLRREVSRQLATGVPSSWSLPQGFIRDVVRHAAKLIPSLEQRPFVYLLDDYTSHRIPPVVQQLLNPIVFSRQAEFLFKISCEKYGFDAQTHDGLHIDENREFERTDAGSYVLVVAKDEEKREFITQLLDARLKEAGYHGRAETLIGRSSFPRDTDLARQIRESRGRSHHYNGLDVLANLWSGDISTILHMVQAMFHRAAVRRESAERIADKYQHEAIRSVSLGLQNQVQHYHPHGDAMYRVLMEFGALASLLLNEGEEDERDGAKTPQRKYRLEMTKRESYELMDRLSGLGSGLDSLAKELLRRTVFVDLGPSRGKESRASETVRWELRPSLLPSFGLSLVRHHYLDVKSLEEFALLLEKPSQFRALFQKRYSSTRAADLFDGPAR
ncbi:MAG: protein kinase family protein [Rhodanobacteraceae bacterium]|nr:protein kinase family protein [Rhodanobacteraceae bacterium]